jgi:hypothetical protein
MFGLMISAAQTIKKAIDRQRIIDTHEHLLQEEERTCSVADPFEIFFSQYASSDLISGGMLLEELDFVRNPKFALEERWKKLEPFWDDIANTGYAKVINIAVRELYGLNGLAKDTYKGLASKMKDANKPGIYKWILKEKAGIDLAFLDFLRRDAIDPVSLSRLQEVDRDFFVPVARFEDFILPRERFDFETLASRYNSPIHTFSDFMHTLEAHFEQVSGMIAGVKIDLAYMRSLHFDKVSEGQAEDVFSGIYNQEAFKTRRVRDKTEVYSSEGFGLAETKPLQDFVVHKLIQLAARKNLVIQIHTGLHEGNDNLLTNADPTLLVNLFSEYREVKFDIFHGGYPYTREVGALAKNFPNVYLDMCWLHIISPSRARQALAEWLDTVPSNKILGFGGDYIFAEGAYGHSMIARDNIARVLTERVDEGSLTVDQAIDLGKKLLYDNAHSFFSCDKLLTKRKEAS